MSSPGYKRYALQSEEINSEEEKRHIASELTHAFSFKEPKSLLDDKKLKVLSLFSGCGGMDLGFEGGFQVPKVCLNTKIHSDYIEKIVGNDNIELKRTRFQIVFANDILKDARQTWIMNFSKYGYDPSLYYSDSIVDLVKRHRAGESVFPIDVDIVTGGFPCQDFSVAGRRKGFDSHKDHNGKVVDSVIPTEESRGKLYYWMKEVIDITKPKIFIAENVKGLVNLGNVKEIIQKDFSTASGNGYLVLAPKVLHAADYGVPQSRERVIFIGIRKDALNEVALSELIKEEITDQYNPYPKPTHSYNWNDEGLAPSVSLKSIFKNLSEPENSEDLSQKFFSKAKYMGKHCQGQNEVNIDGIGPTIRSEHHGNIEFRRLSEEHGGKNKEELNKQNLIERRLTPRECALIQTFPMDYEFVIGNRYKRNCFLVSPSSAYKIIGNAVPPLLAYHLAMSIQYKWSKYFE